MRERPWLEPCLWPTRNCSWTTTSTSRRERARAVASPITPAPTTATLARANCVPEHADPLDFELDDVAGLEPAPVSVLEYAARTDRPRTDHVARQEPRVARSLFDERPPRMVHVAQIPPRPLLAVDAGHHLEPQVAQLAGCDDDGAEARR